MIHVYPTSEGKKERSRPRTDTSRQVKRRLYIITKVTTFNNLKVEISHGNCILRYMIKNLALALEYPPLNRIVQDYLRGLQEDPPRHQSLEKEREMQLSTYNKEARIFSS